MDSVEVYEAEIRARLVRNAEADLAVASDRLESLRAQVGLLESEVAEWERQLEAARRIADA